MEKIEIGEYGRTNLGKIIKFVWLQDSEGKTIKNKVILINEKKISNDFYYFHKEENIVKHSKQLIDLIEKDDYVNGSKVLAVMEDMKTGELHLEMTFNYTNEEIGDCTIYDKDIKTILTKEQFEANCYKVGGEDE